MPRRRQSALEAYAQIAGLSLLMLAILAGAGMVARQTLFGSVTQTYYDQTYSPIAIDPTLVGSPPAEAHLADVPWYSTDQLLGPVSSLRMVAARQGTAVSDAAASFLMGYTYGARHYTGLTLYPFPDADAGQDAAAPALGLKRLYYKTDAADLYLRAIRQEVARGRPVYVSLDRAKLVGGPGPIPNGVLVVGYDSGHLYYYETTCDGATPCQAGDRAPGERGVSLADDAFLGAVESWSKAAEYPWRYGYGLFEAGAKSENLAGALRRNGQLLAGQFQTGPIQGARAVESVADLLERSAGKPEIDGLVIGLEAAGPARLSSASYLRVTFPSVGAVAAAADQLDRSAASYSLALAALRAGRSQSDVSAAASRLREAAAADRAAGELLAGVQ